jgi:hypothetical protein
MTPEQMAAIERLGKLADAYEPGEYALADGVFSALSPSARAEEGALAHFPDIPADAPVGAASAAVAAYRHHDTPPDTARQQAPGDPLPGAWPDGATVERAQRAVSKELKPLSGWLSYNDEHTRAIAVAALLAAPPPPEWRRIDQNTPTGRKGCFVIAQYPNGPTWSDPYFAWQESGKWQRWPHAFPPTHWMPLPAPPSDSQGGVK